METMTFDLTLWRYHDMDRIGKGGSLNIDRKRGRGGEEYHDTQRHSDSQTFYLYHLILLYTTFAQHISIHTHTLFTAQRAPQPS